jgi:hypothetical protein
MAELTGDLNDVEADVDDQVAREGMAEVVHRQFRYAVSI